MTVTNEVSADAVEVTPTFFLIDITTKDDEKVQLRTNAGDEEAAKAAQVLATGAVEKGTYTANIDNGIQVISVKTATVTGPYEEKPTEEVESVIQEESEQEDS